MAPGLLLFLHAATEGWIEETPLPADVTRTIVQWALAETPVRACAVCTAPVLVEQQHLFASRKLVVEWQLCGQVLVDTRRRRIRHALQSNQRPGVQQVLHLAGRSGVCDVPFTPTHLTVRDGERLLLFGNLASVLAQTGPYFVRGDLAVCAGCTFTRRRMRARFVRWALYRRCAPKVRTPMTR